MLLSLLACANPWGAEAGLTGEGPLWPYPSLQLVDEEGRVAIPVGVMPEVETSFDLQRLRSREGFSVVQSALVRLEDVDPAALPGRHPVEGPGAVRLIDLDSGLDLRSFAELDLSPGQDGDLLVVRPLERMTPGHRVAVVVTTEAAPRPDRFRAILADEDPEDIGEMGRCSRELVDELEGLGVDADDVAIAWEFPVGDGRASLTTMVDELGPTHGWSWNKISTVEDNLPVGIHKRLIGSYSVDNWLVEDIALELDDQGMPVQQPEPADYDLYVHVPASVAEAEPGTVPVLLWGHGLFNHPSLIFGDPEDPDDFIEWADRMGMIVVATSWRGLAREDMADAIWIANDIGRFSEMTDRLHQGVVNNLALMELVQDGGLMDDPELLGLADPSQLYYVGVSAGAILGGVTLANTDRVDHGVLHVGGAAWSITFPRSANWEDFEALVSENLTDPDDRQLVYAMTQLYWDPVDPASWAPELADRKLLLQETLGDDEVTNIGTELLARSAGWPVLAPYADLPADCDAMSGGQGPALVQFDPELGDPDNGNQPSSRTGAHREVRTWESAKLQATRFLDASDPGVVEHYCGDEVCAPDSK
jgi:hypothetical protein